MSVQTENRGEKLRKWRQELDARCEEHLLMHPEEEAPKHLLSAPSEAQPLKVRCFESMYAPGAWNVYVGEQRITTFTGVGAKEKAAEMAFELTNRKPSGS